MNAASIAKALGGHKVGGAFMASCPAHADRTPSLAIRDGDDGRILIRCHAGCAQGAVISELKALGLWPHNRRGSRSPSPPNGKRAPAVSGDETVRTVSAMALWEAARPATGTPVVRYLAARGLEIPPPPSLRFHPHLSHPSGKRWPAMVALVTRGTDGTPMAVHRTFLAHDGKAKAPVEPSRMMLGPCRGGAVRLGICQEVLMVGEGVETCLAAVQASGYPAWAALSTSGLRNLDLPINVTDVVVLADGDDPGEAAALACSRRWRRQGRNVRIARAPRGSDFNDLINAEEQIDPFCEVLP